MEKASPTCSGRSGNFLRALIEAQGSAPKIAAAQATPRAGGVFVRGARQRAVALSP